MTTSISAKSLPDTVLLLDFAAGSDEIDYSQYRTDLTNNGTYLSEANSARTAIGAGTDFREITVSVDISTGETGILVQLGNNVSYSYRMAVVASNVLECRENGTLRVSATLPSIAVGDRTYIICWSQYPYAGTVRSELFIYQTTAATYAHDMATHAAGTVSATDTLTVGAGYGGATAFAGGLDFQYVRIGWRHHSFTETYEQFVTATSQPTMTQVRGGTPLVPDRGSLDIASDESFVGPALLWSGHGFAESARRLLGPLVNIQVRDPVTLDNDYNDASTAWWRLAPQATDLHMNSSLVWYRPVSPKCNRARVRIFAYQASAGTVCPMQYRMYSMAGLPCAGEPLQPFEFRRTAEVQDSTDHDATSELGEWLDLGALQIVRDEWGCSWFALAFSFDHDSSSANADGTDVQIKAVTIEPYYEEGEDGMDVLNP